MSLTRLACLSLVRSVCALRDSVAEGVGGQALPVCAPEGVALARDACNTWNEITFIVGFNKQFQGKKFIVLNNPFSNALKWV